MKKIKIIALFGEAGSGKDYLYNKVIRWDEDGALDTIFNQIVKSTTRPIRENEINGVHYYFLTDEEFKLYQKTGLISAVSEYRGWYYGINAGAVSTIKPNIVILDIQQIRDLLKKEEVDLTLFKITASPKTRMLRQLNREENPDVDEINRRYEADKIEYASIDFDYVELRNETAKDADLAMLEIMRAGVAAATGKNN